MITRWRILGATAVAIGVARIAVACSPPPDTTAVTQIFTNTSSYTDFAGGGTNAGVVGFITHRCGTLDCHGEIGRPLRLFSRDGLRLVDDAGDIPGGAATTQAEIFADYVSVIGVQPELTSLVFYGIEDPHALLLLRKPLGLERHKGGQVIQPGDDGDSCLTSWFEDEDGGGLDNGACTRAAAAP